MLAQSNPIPSPVSILRIIGSLLHFIAEKKKIIKHAFQWVMHNLIQSTQEEVSHIASNAILQNFRLSCKTLAASTFSGWSSFTEIQDETSQ